MSTESAHTAAQRREELLRIVSRYINGTAWNRRRWHAIVGRSQSSKQALRSCSRALRELADETSPAPAQPHVDTLAESITVPVLDASSATDPRLRRLLTELTHPWPRAVLALMVHGSVADATTVGYSDVDLVMILDSTASDGELRAVRGRTLEACRAILRFQPDQHHGIEIVPSSLTPHVPGDVVPQGVLSLLRQLLLDRPAVVLSPRREQSEFAAARRLASAVARADVPSTSYDAMLLLSQVMLLPAVEHAALDRDDSKSEAIEAWRSAGEDRYLAADLASQARLLWPIPQPDLWDRLLRRPLNPWLVSALRRRTSPPIHGSVLPFVDGTAVTVYRRAARVVLDALEEVSR